MFERSPSAAVPESLVRGSSGTHCIMTLPNSAFLNDVAKQPPCERRAQAPIIIDRPPAATVRRNSVLCHVGGWTFVVVVAVGALWLSLR